MELQRPRKSHFDVVPIVQLYTALGRAPDQAGLGGMGAQPRGSGASLTNIAGDFLSSPEGQGITALPSAQVRPRMLPSSTRCIRRFSVELLIPSARKIGRTHSTPGS